jgi:hypothetical protein
MGWAGGHEVFDPVANALIQLNVSGIVMFEVCKALIGPLQERGWDTEGESLGEFRDYPEIVAAFAVCGVELDEEED